MSTHIYLQTNYWDNCQNAQPLPLKKRGGQVAQLRTEALPADTTITYGTAD